MEAKRVRYVSPGVAEVQVHLSSQTNNGLTVQIERTNPKDPVRNLHVVMPGYENQFLAQPFHPTFLEAMKKYKIIRFMKWMDGDGAGKGDWASRPTRQSASYAWSHLNRPKGASLEDIIFLSNRLGASPWFVLQTSIEDDYVTKFAALVRDTLRPDVKVYVELGNEVWSTLHRTGQYAHEQGLRTGLGPHPYIRLYCETWPQAAHFLTGLGRCWLVKRTREIAKIIKSVLVRPRKQLQVVLGTQSGNIDVLRQLLQCDTGSGGDDIDAVGIAPYFNGYATNEQNQILL